MKERLLCLCVFALLVFQMVSAQQKRLKELKDDYSTIVFSYDDEDRMTSIDEEKTHGTSHYDIVYDGDVVRIEETSTDGATKVKTYQLTNGLVTRHDAGEGYYINLVYEHNRLKTFEESSDYPVEHLWQDGNIVETKQYGQDGELRIQGLYTYNNMSAHPLVRYMWGGLDGLGWPDAFVFYRNVGELPANLISHVETRYYGKQGYTSSHHTDTEYETDSEGEVVKIVEYYDGWLNNTIILVWEEGVTGLKGVRANDGHTAVAYYSVNGSRLHCQQRGVNIIRKADGTCKKVIAK